MSCGLAIIAASTIFAVLTLYGSTTPIIHADANPYTSGVIISMVVMMILVIAYTAYRKGKTWKEALTYLHDGVFLRSIPEAHNDPGIPADFCINGARG